MAIPSAPATSPAMAAGRGSPNPMPAGLSALLKPDAASRGKPAESMEKLFNVAKDLPDSVLADVLAGRSLQVPQYLAMLVATGRKNLRTAMQGVQARAQMQQPSVKDKLMAEETVSPMMGQPMPGQIPVMAAEGGLASLPAPNMDSVDMADGGIIAFEDGGEVPRFNEGGNWFERWRDSLAGPQEKYLVDYQRGKKTEMPEGVERLSPGQINAIRTGKTPGPAEMAPFPPGVREEVEASKMRLFKQEMADKERREKEEKEAAVAPKPSTAKKEISAAAPTAAAPTAADSGMSGLKSYMDAIKANQEDYYKKVEGMGAKAREGLAQLRRQGGGEALMNLAQGILSKPGLAAGIAAGLPGVTQTAASSRKEQRAIESLANEYDMNLAKARAADAKGNTDAALKFMDLANTAKYRADALNIERMNAGTAAARANQLPEGVRVAEYLKANPEMARFFPNIGKQERISMDNASKQWLDAQKDISAKKALEAQGIYSVMDLYNALNLGSVQSATIPGQGAPIIGKL